MLAEGAHAGIALDGDADRVIFCDEKGSIVDGDATLAILATHMHRTSALYQQHRRRHDDEQPRS